MNNSHKSYFWVWVSEIPTWVYYLMRVLIACVLGAGTYVFRLSACSVGLCTVCIFNCLRIRIECMPIQKRRDLMLIYTFY